VFVLAVQTVALPLMDPSVGSTASTDTVRLAAGETPQAFEAVTVTVPPVGPAVAVMEFVVEAPVHPPGNVQM
jgi:hypothetical protein